MYNMVLDWYIYMIIAIIFIFMPVQYCITEITNSNSIEITIEITNSAEDSSILN